MQQPAVLTIDGGFATQLTEHVGQRIDGDPLWSARFNATQPAAVVQTHLDLLRAGAQVILTNTYQARVSGYGKHLALTRDESLALMRTSVRLAHQARKQFLAEQQPASDADASAAVLPAGLPWIFASIGPYGAHLNDGSEYTGAYGDSMSKEAIKAFHRDRLQAVCAEGVDGLAIETVPCALEAEAMAELMAAEFPQQRYWMSFQCSADGVHLAHAGERFAEVARYVWDRVNGDQGQGQLLAVGLNCLNPEVNLLKFTLECNLKYFFLATLARQLHAESPKRRPIAG